MVVKKTAKKAVKAVKKVTKAAPAKAAPSPATKKPAAKQVATPAPAAPKAAAKTVVKAAPAKPVAPAKAAAVAPQKKAPAHEPRPAAPRASGVVAGTEGRKVARAVKDRSAAPAPKPKLRKVDYKTDPATGRPVLPAGYKPGNDEEYMNPLQMEYFRQRLLQWRADLVEESKQTIENLKDEVRDVGDEAERATRETENSLELRTRDRYRKLIGKIDSTLKRLDGGDYGYCVDTGEEIGLERLEARLTAERTLDAQERWEHLQKQQGD